MVPVGYLLYGVPIMKAFVITVAVLVLLLFAALGGMQYQKVQRTTAERERDAVQQQLNATGTVLTEVRAIKQDISEVLAALDANKARQAEAGEKRREDIRKAVSADKCAAAVVPAAAADSLRRHAEELNAGDYSGIITGNSDKKF